MAAKEIQKPPLGRIAAYFGCPRHRQLFRCQNGVVQLERSGSQKEDRGTKFGAIAQAQMARGCKPLCSGHHDRLPADRQECRREFAPGWPDAR